MCKFIPPSGVGARPPVQLSLFADNTATTLPTVVSPRPCPRCGGVLATLSSSGRVHAGELRCAACNAHLMWASHAFAAEARAPFVTGVSSWDPGMRP
jgi:hypothetical protein